MSAVEMADDDSANARPSRTRIEPRLRTFAFYIDDDRYSVPSLNVVSMADEARARAWAEGALRENPHYLGVEVCEDGERLFGVGSLADNPRAE